MIYGFKSGFQPNVPIRVENGIRTRNTRGAIGNSWWSKRWLKAMEQASSKNALDGGRRYARKGQVMTLDPCVGHINARVQGTRETPYTTILVFRQFEQTAWNAILSRLLDDLTHIAELLAATLPKDVESFIEEALAQAGESGPSLFPDFAEDPICQCDCGSEEPICKHVTAVNYLFAERLDEDPFLLLKLRGMAQADLQRRWRREWGVRATPSKTPTSSHVRPEVDFYGHDHEALPELEEQALEHIDVLERLGFPSFFPAKDEHVVRSLRQLYERH